MRSRHKSIKATLDDTFRPGLGAKPSSKHRSRFVIGARPLDLRPDIDPTGLNKLADDFEIDSIVAKRRRLSKR